MNKHLKREKYIFVLICINFSGHNNKFGLWGWKNKIIVQSAGKRVEKCKKKTLIGRFI